ncbi:MAG TPA: DUF6221 family protein [Arthrobacter sp.]|nr:hypothetical protein [Arthrobacter sp.]MDQ1622031.1 hypothetical protein [Actinomycetota bacterium]HET6269655.1 DUF6221 family protein [Arthrobacter sp.]
MDIVEFLSQRIKEDEAAAQRLLSDRSVSESGKWYEWRLLRECEAKRRLLGITESARQAALATMISSAARDLPWIPEVIEWTTLSLNALALPYSDHPDFQDAWKLSP